MSRSSRSRYVSVEAHHAPRTCSIFPYRYVTPTSDVLDADIQLRAARLRTLSGPVSLPHALYAVGRGREHLVLREPVCKPGQLHLRGCNDTSGAPKRQSYWIWSEKRILRLRSVAVNVLIQRVTKRMQYAGLKWPGHALCLCCPHPCMELAESATAILCWEAIWRLSPCLA